MTHPQFDIVVRGGFLCDGSGDAGYEGDVAVLNGRIVGVGRFAGHGSEEIDARGKIVTPGFVDIHTHYDGHATWTSRLAPSSHHGVTTVLTGNCGVGFAPCRPDRREALVALMEGVEDIPQAVMAAGLPWSWQSFGEYLDMLERRSFDMDVGTQIPHAPVRIEVMGERALNHEAATEAEAAAMGRIVGDAIRQGAFGFSTSRTIAHRSRDGRLTPTIQATEAELTAISQAVGATGTGVLQLISDFNDAEAEFDMVERVVRAGGRPASVSLMQTSAAPARWRYLLDRIDQANQSGLNLKGQVSGRPVGVLLGLTLSYNPFSFCPTYRQIAELPLAQRLDAMRDPGTRAAILSEFPTIDPGEPFSTSVCLLGDMSEMEEYPDYEPPAESTIEARAARAGVAPEAFVYDLMTAGDGEAVLYLPRANYENRSIEAARTMMASPNTIFGLGDGGAHCGIVCDASLTTYTLQRWATTTGESGRLPVEEIVAGLTSRTARAVGLGGRGLIKTGYLADLNVIDFSEVRVCRPHMVPDLPGGGARLEQGARGYDATIKSGRITYRDGVATGELPGRLVRNTGDVSRRAA